MMIGRLSTGVKMLLILTAALLPLGLIALLASLQSADQNRASRNAASRLVASDAAERLNLFIGRSAVMLRAASTALGEQPPGSPACQRTIDALAASYRSPVRLAVFNAQGRLVCAVRGFRPSPPPPIPLAEASQVEIADSESVLQLTARAAMNGAIGIAEIPRETVERIARPNAAPGSFALQIARGERTLKLAAMAATPLTPPITVTAPLSRQRLTLSMTMAETPISSSEMLMIVLPLLMWVAAAGIGWAVMDRLILRPLAKLQEAIGAYRTGSAHVVIPAMTTPAREIRRLGEAFSGVTQIVAQHEAELEEGLLRQTRLTREVHHRVKNNLQVVASLLSLHARSARTPDVAAAYASIQRRVDALAIVHRNHYAELEENRGVALRPLVAELAANLRGSMPDDRQAPAITLDLKPFYAAQDVAVSIAFLITELVEMALLCTPSSRIAISLDITQRDERALLSVTSPALRNDACEDIDMAHRFNRVIEGLSRQLRSTLVRDEEGRMAIEIAVMPNSDYGAAHAAAAAPIAAVPPGHAPRG